MPITDLTKTDAEHIQAILQYIRENGVIHKDLLPDALAYIPPGQYAVYRKTILEIKPAVVEYDPLSNNMGLPATEYLETYLHNGGFLRFYNSEQARMQQDVQDRQLALALQQQQIESHRRQTSSNRDAIEVGKAANNKATIAMILATIALLIEVIRIVMR